MLMASRREQEKSSGSSDTTVRHDQRVRLAGGQCWFILREKYC
jgi:hypothetical protein